MALNLKPHKGYKNLWKDCILAKNKKTICKVLKRNIGKKLYLCKKINSKIMQFTDLNPALRLSQSTCDYDSLQQGTSTPWSDIDLALFSSAFEGDRFKDRNKIRKIKLKISSSLEPIPFPLGQYFAADPFVEQIKKTGISVKGE